MIHTQVHRVHTAGELYDGSPIRSSQEYDFTIAFNHHDCIWTAQSDRLGYELDLHEKWFHLQFI